MKYVYLCRNIAIFVRFEDSPAGIVKIAAFCGVTPYSLVTNASECSTSKLALLLNPPKFSALKM
jgi:hypothetical protein